VRKRPNTPERIAILTIVRDHGPLTIKQIAAQAGRSLSPVYEHVRLLVGLGYLDQGRSRYVGAVNTGALVSINELAETMLKRWERLDAKRVEAREDVRDTLSHGPLTIREIEDDTGRSYSEVAQALEDLECAPPDATGSYALPGGISKRSHKRRS
jgi:predicted transcriptional regulator